MPNVNLVSNAGFREDATHTRVPSPVANLPVEEFPKLTAPWGVKADTEADRFLFRYVHQGNPIPPMSVRERLWSAA